MIEKSLNFLTALWYFSITYDLMSYVTSTLNGKSLVFRFFKNRLNIGSILGNDDKSQFFLAINKRSRSFQVRDSKMLEILRFFEIFNLLTWSSAAVEIQFHEKRSICVGLDFDDVVFFRKSCSYQNKIGTCTNLFSILKTYIFMKIKTYSSEEIRGMLRKFENLLLWWIVRMSELVSFQWPFRGASRWLCQHTILYHSCSSNLCTPICVSPNPRAGKPRHSIWLLHRSCISGEWSCHKFYCRRRGSRWIFWGPSRWPFHYSMTVISWRQGHS